MTVYIIARYALEVRLLEIAERSAIGNQSIDLYS